MKNFILYFFLASFICCVSCRKELTPELPMGNNTSNVDSLVPPNTAGISEPSLSFITLNSSGQYVSGYGGSVNFGTVLQHPIDDPTGIYDGWPIPHIEWVNWDDFAYQIPNVIDGAYFTLLRPTFATSGLLAANATITNIRNYQQAVYKIFTSTDWIELKRTKLNALPSPVIGGPVNGPGGFIRVTGMVIRDHNSPTRMSIVTEKFVTPPPVSLKLVGSSLKSGNTLFRMYAPQSANSGPVTRVIVTKNGVEIAVAAFDITWSGDLNVGFTTVGYVTIIAGQPIAINDFYFP